MPPTRRSKNMRSRTNRSIRKSRRGGGNLSLTLKTLTGKEFKIIAESSDTVKSIKDKVANEGGMNVDRVRLIYNGKDLEDKRSLSDYDVQDNTIIHIVLKHFGHGRRKSRRGGGNLSLTLKTLTGKEFKIIAESSDTVKSIKDKVANEGGMNVDRVRLIYNGKDLEDKRSLSDYDVQDNTIIHIVLKHFGH